MIVTNLSFAVAVVYLCSLVGLAIYRLFSHPLSKFPGPKIAAVTRWYEFYFSVIKRGEIMWTVQDWHKRYGGLPPEITTNDYRSRPRPIVRVSPHEIHIDDPDYVDEIFAPVSKRRDKYD